MPGPPIMLAGIGEVKEGLVKTNMGIPGVHRYFIVKGNYIYKIWANDSEESGEQQRFNEVLVKWLGSMEFE